MDEQSKDGLESALSGLYALVNHGWPLQELSKLSNAELAGLGKIHVEEQAKTFIARVEGVVLDLRDIHPFDRARLIERGTSEPDKLTLNEIRALSQLAGGRQHF